MHSVLLILATTAAHAVLAQDDGQQNGAGGDGGGGDGGSARSKNALLLSHALILSAPFLVLYPLGAIFNHFKAPIMKVHLPWQVLALLVSLAGVGIGIKLADVTDIDIGGSTHTILGLLIVFALLGLQPLGGFLQHRHAKKNMSQRGILGFAHIWFGRVMILLGIINGGLGFELAGHQHAKERVTPYVVIAAIMGALYIALIGWDVVRTKGRSEAIKGPTEKIG